MHLSDYLRLARRNAIMLVLVPLLLGLGGWLYAASKPKQYSSAALVLLRPADPNENLDSVGRSQVGWVDYEALSQSQIQVAISPAVAERAAGLLPNTPIGKIEGARSVSAANNFTVLRVACTSTDPNFVEPCANALATAYIESRRVAAVAGLQTAIDNVNEQLDATFLELESLAKEADSDRLRRSTGLGGNLLPSQVPLDPSLQASIDATTARYKTLLDRQSNLEININLKRGEAELISGARAPGAPFAPTPKRTAMLAGILGLMLAAGIAVARDQLDTKIRSSGQLEVVTGLPVLTKLPLHAGAGADPTFLPIVRDTFSSFSERIRELRTSIKFLGASQELRSVVVTSSVPSEGKSIVSANLAAAFAQTGTKVLLVSGDLRRPRLDTMFNTSDDGVGLSDLITELAHAHRNGDLYNYRDALERAVEATQIDGLGILRAGVPPPNPNEMLGSPTMRSLLIAAAEIYDVVIIDSPPLAAVSDAIVLGGLVDGVLLVASAKRSDRRLVAQSAEQLRAAGLRIMGTVYNRANNRGSRYSYSYGYKYQTGYGPEPEKPSRFRWPRGNDQAVRADGPTQGLWSQPKDDAVVPRPPESLPAPVSLSVSVRRGDDS